MITGTQVRMARAAVRLGVREVAAAAKVSPATLTRVENGQPANASTLAAIQGALEAVGVEFTDGNAPGVRLKPLLTGLSDEISLDGRSTSIQGEFDAGRGTSFRLVSKSVAGDQPDQHHATVWSNGGETVTFNISHESFTKLRRLGVTTP